MRRWLWRVAVPPVAFLLGWSTALICCSSPSKMPLKAPTRADLERFLEPSLRHGGCQGPLQRQALKDLKHPQNYKSYFARCCCTEHQRQATPTPGREDLDEEDAQLPDLLSHYEHKRRNRPCATR
jgi:hypothetical protein